MHVVFMHFLFPLLSRMVEAKSSESRSSTAAAVPAQLSFELLHCYQNTFGAKRSRLTLQPRAVVWSASSDIEFGSGRRQLIDSS